MDKKQIEAFYTYIQSQQSAQHYLSRCYQSYEGIDASVKSFENSSKFMHYLNHGLTFYENGKRLNMLLQPMLFFYGMVHLIKASLLTIRPDYPESTAILAHGLSSRKRKKRHYNFLDDDVKIQHNGLFPYFSEHLFSIRRIPAEKMNMVRNLSLIPEMAPMFKLHNQNKLTEIGNIGAMQLRMPTVLLDNYHLTANTLIQRVKAYLPAIQKTDITDEFIYISLATPFYPRENSPFFTDTDQTIYLPLHRDDFSPISEVMVHYVLLYNLSMLCRYEPEWWGELLSAKPDSDYPFICHFLELTAEKMPLILGNHLLSMTHGQ